jgi:hypothetical protein
VPFEIGIAIAVGNAIRNYPIADPSRRSGSANGFTIAKAIAIPRNGEAIATDAPRRNGGADQNPTAKGRGFKSE